MYKMYKKQQSFSPFHFAYESPENVNKQLKNLDKLFKMYYYLLI